ncbi:MAG: YigZ family protein [Bacteroidetes bacterium]|jgi:uncharacterized YigZ family protein|nr:YigZ family protein [Bacteroidota bacterium]
MNNDDTYLTILEISKGLYKEKGSKFISFAHPVQSEEQVKTIVTRYKKEHKNARHHCYAYKIGVESAIRRMNDDGEPSGTAGKPIYGQILSNNLTNILVMVVRYFGGILLGAGGLVTAYKNAASEALTNATIITKHIRTIFTINYNYDNTNTILRLIKQYNANTIASTYTAECEQKVAVRQSLAKEFYNTLNTLDSVKIKQESES